MISRLQNWWKEGQDGAVAIYPARLLLPVAFITIMVSVGLVASFQDSPELSWYFPATWVVSIVPVLLRRRRAAIFTHDTFLYRPVFGHPLRIPLSGIKRAYFVDKNDRRGGFVRLEVFVGGQLDVRLNVSKPGEVIRRLQAAAH